MTLGADLTQDQKNTMMKYFNVDSNQVQILTITNQDERDHLRDVYKRQDRMYPSQDVASSIGNLIALPLQGQALKNGNSAFVDENWNAYPDQWDALLDVYKRQMQRAVFGIVRYKMQKKPVC